MGIEEMLLSQQEGEREGLRYAAEYFGHDNIAEFGRKIIRADGDYHTDFDVVTKQGDVCEVFGAGKSHHKYQRQLRRIATAIEQLKDRESECLIDNGEHYSGRFFIFFNEDWRNERLEEYVRLVQENHSEIDMQLVYRKDI